MGHSPAATGLQQMAGAWTGGTWIAAAARAPIFTVRRCDASRASCNTRGEADVEPCPSDGCHLHVSICCAVVVGSG